MDLKHHEKALDAARARRDEIAAEMARAMDAGLDVEHPEREEIRRRLERAQDEVDECRDQVADAVRALAPPKPPGWQPLG